MQFPTVFVKFEASLDNYRVITFPTVKYTCLLDEFSLLNFILNFSWFLSNWLFSSWGQNFVKINFWLLNCIINFVIRRLKLSFGDIFTYIVDSKVLFSRWTECKMQIDLFYINQSTDMKSIVQNRFCIQSTSDNQIFPLRFRAFFSIFSFLIIVFLDLT
jgi:hypothetical protein